MRDYHRGKTTSGGGSKFNAKKTYTPYGGKRFEALGRPKRTLRKTGAKSDGGSSAGHSEAGSLGSEERSSESGSHRSEGDRCDETDSTSTGRGSYNADRKSQRGPIISDLPRQESQGSQGSQGSLNSNGNNNQNQDLTLTPISPASIPAFVTPVQDSPPSDTQSEPPRTPMPDPGAVTPDSCDSSPRPLTLDLSLVGVQRQTSTPSEPYTPNLEDIRARLAEIEMACEDTHWHIVKNLDWIAGGL